MRCHVVHGILDPLGKAGILKLVPLLQAAGFECLVPDYGFITAVEAKLINPSLVGTIRPYVLPGDLWIAHSNGCAIGYHLLAAGAPFGGMLLINPALQPNLSFPTGLRVIVCSNKGDDATVLAQAGAQAGLLDPVWGEMGHTGYIGSNPDVQNLFADRCPPLPLVDGHGDIFTDAKFAGAWGPRLVLCAADLARGP